MELEDLEDLFDDLDISGPTPAQLHRMYGVFLNDIVKNPIQINGRSLKFNNNRSNHPICKGKPIAFEHIITRDNKFSGKRQFDRERANKIHWIRPILLNANDPRIFYFEAVNDREENQFFYWYFEKAHLVIIREIQPEILLITSFSVDTHEKHRYRKMHDAYRK